MLCSKCGAENSPDARFCGSCGGRLGLNCSNCGAGVTGTQRFCSDCGHATTSSSHASTGVELLGTPATYTPPHLAERILADRRAVHGERKHVTVLFCDLVGSTALADSLGPEPMHELLSDFFNVSLDCVHRFEGTVNQFLGDGFMAIFGAPLAYEDHAARAALTAVALRESIAEHRAQAPLPGWEHVQIRMGLNSGEVVVGAIGDDLRMDYTATGDITNVAARLEALAVPGEILCGETTVLAARDVIEAELRAPVPLKGKAAPIVYYRLLSANELTLRGLRTAAEFVGREHEMTTLMRALDRTLAGQGGTVEIEGEPGVGKSRLIAEFTDAAAADATVALGHCITYGRQVPNVPIIDLIRSLLGLETSAADESTVAALSTALGPDSTDHVDAIGALIGVAGAVERMANVGPATGLGRTTQGLIRLVERLASETPLVLIIEDLHWADASSLNYLAALYAVLDTNRVLLAATFRPGSDPPWATQSRISRLLMAPLEDAQAKMLIESLDENSALSSEDAAQVLKRGEGNPFFIEELVRADVHGDENVPGDIFDVLGARIDRLSADDKDLLRTASAVGRQFDLDLLEDVVEQRATVRGGLENLVSLGFVESIARRRYSFVHALTQHVAYDGMLGADTRRLHSTIAERLIDQVNSPEEGSDLIAHHFLEGELPAKAIPHLETAITKAIGTHAMEAAHDYFEHALRLLEAEPPDTDNVIRRVTLLLTAFPMFHFTHRHEEYAGLIERYRTAVDDLGDSPLRGAFLAQRGHRLWTAGRYYESIEVLIEGERVSSAVGDRAGAAHAEQMLCWSHSYRGEFDAAIGHGFTALEHLRIRPDPVTACQVHVGLLLTYFQRGQWPAAAEHGNAAREIGIAADDDGLAAFGGTFYSMIVTASGDPTGGMEVAQRALDEAPTDYFRGFAAGYLAFAMCRAGDATASLPILEQAFAFPRRVGHIAGSLFNSRLLIEARLETGDVRGALELALTIRAEANAAGVPFIAAVAETFLGEIDLVGQANDSALEHFRRAAGEARAIGAEDAWCQARFGEGRALVSNGDSAGAKEVLDDALAGFERLRTGLFPEKVRAALTSMA